MVKNIFIKRFLLFPVSPNAAIFLKYFLKIFKKKNNEVRNSSIIVYRLDGIGDVVLTTAFLRELRRNFPHKDIVLVVSKSSYNLVELCPYVNEIIIYKKIKFYILTPYIKYFNALIFSIKYLWKKNIELSINPRWDVDNDFTNFILYFSFSKKNYAYSEKVNNTKSIENRNYDKLVTNPVCNTIIEHEVLINLKMLNFIGLNYNSNKIELWLDKSDYDNSSRIFSSNQSKIIAIGPGALDKNRMWPIERYIEIINWIQNQYEDLLIVILGGKNEEIMMNQIMNNDINSRLINLCGKLTLREVAAVLSKCNLFIVNDTGLKHIAAAMQIPIIEISRFPKYGNKMHSQSPFRFRAWDTVNVVLQPLEPLLPCNDNCIFDFPHCIQGVSIDNVKEEIIKIVKSDFCKNQ